MARPPGHNTDRNKYPHSCCTSIHIFYSSFHLATKQHHGYCWKQYISCLAKKYREVSSSQRRNSANGRRFIPTDNSARLCSQQGLTRWKMAMSLFQTCHLLAGGGGREDIQSLKNPQFVLVFINRSRLKVENCQLLDLMAMVANKLVTSAQRCDVIWDAEAITWCSCLSSGVLKRRDFVICSAWSLSLFLTLLVLCSSSCCPAALQQVRRGCPLLRVCMATDTWQPEPISLLIRSMHLLVSTLLH